MKTAKKALAILLALVMVVALGVSAFAAASDPGSITVKNATKGAVYEAYKILEAVPNADASAVVYKVDASKTDLIKALEDSGYFVVSEVASQGKFSVAKKGNPSGEDIAKWADENKALFEKLPAAGVYQDDGTVLFDKVAYGYYFVTSSLGTVCSVDTNTPNVEIKDKNPNAPSYPVKTVNGEAADEAAIGTVQEYKVTFNATNWVNEEGKDPVQVKYYDIVDVYENLRIVGDVTVKVNGDEVDVDAVVTPNADEATGGKIEVHLDWIDANGASLYAYKDGALNIPVEISYKAEVTSAAVNTAKNEVNISNNAQPNPMTVSTETTTYNLVLNKVDENGQPLAGAKFNIILDGEPVLFVKVAGAAADSWDYRVADSKEAGSAEIVIDADGSVKICGLDKATYTVKETEAPFGYKLAADQDVDVGENGVDGTSVTVTDLFGSKLPSTGSIGTTIFYIFGSILVIGAGIVLVSKRRMSE